MCFVIMSQYSCNDDVFSMFVQNEKNPGEKPAKKKLPQPLFLPKMKMQQLLWFCSFWWTLQLLSSLTLYAFSLSLPLCHTLTLSPLSCLPSPPFLPPLSPYLHFYRTLSLSLLDSVPQAKIWTLYWYVQFLILWGDFCHQTLTNLQN